MYDYEELLDLTNTYPDKFHHLGGKTRIFASDVKANAEKAKKRVDMLMRMRAKLEARKSKS